MIDNGEINAVIDEEAGMVSFRDQIDDNSYKFAMEMEGISKRVVDLIGTTEGRIEDIMLDASYIKRTSDIFRESGMGNMGGMGTMGMHFL
jgi:archaellum component FlaC